jgi:hypothetical protein
MKKILVPALLALSLIFGMVGLSDAGNHFNVGGSGNFSGPDPTEITLTGGSYSGVWRAGSGTSYYLDGIQLITDTGAGGLSLTTDGGNVNGINITDTGKVGIGTLDPAYKLHVTDSAPAKIGLDGGSYGGILRVGTGSTRYLAGMQLITNTGAGGLSLTTNGGTVNGINITDAGLVGIGTLSPDKTLTVVGPAGDAILVDNKITGAGSHLIFDVQNSGNIIFREGNSEAMRINSSGYVGVGTDIPSEKLYVVGNIYATGTITPGSSRELKEDISNLSLEEAMETVEALEPVKFRYKADTGDLHLGFIAEDVPEIVATPERKGISPMDLVAVLTRVVQEQQRMIAEISKKMEAFERQLMIVEMFRIDEMHSGLKGEAAR